MRKLVTNKIFMITVLAMIIFASFSVFLINFLQNKMKGESVRKFSEMYANQIEAFTPADDPMSPTIYTPDDKETIGPNKYDEIVVLDKIHKLVNSIDINALRLVVSTKDGNVLADNAISDSTETENNISEEEGFQEILQGRDNTYIVTSTHYVNTVVMHYRIVSNDYLADDIVLRVEMLVNYQSTYFVMMVPIILVALVIVLIVYYLLLNGVVEDVISPLTNIHKNLVDISSGEYHKYQINSKYEEVQHLADEVDNASLKIATSLKYLNYEREKSRFILDNMSQGILAIAPDNTLILMNESAQDILNCNSTLLGEKIDVSVNDASLLDKFNKIVQEREDCIFEYQREDRIYSIESKNVVESWYDGKDGVITLFIFIDITSESQSVNIRSEFFANASHELKTPLTAIKGFSELLSIANDPAMVAKCSGEIMKNTDKMLNLINDMLNLARMEAKIPDSEFEILDLRAIAEEVKNKISSIALAKNIDVTITGNGKIVGVEKQIEEVLINLMDNAIKYNKENGYVKVNIVSNADTVTVTVEDNGIGIDSKHHSRIFERFYIVDKSRDKKVSSTGLGLSIVKHIINVHKGKIGMSSKLGVGTKFTVEFPSPDKFDSTLNR